MLAIRPETAQASVARREGRQETETTAMAEGRKSVAPRDRQARLEAALRENLRRRKLQARSRGDAERGKEDGAEPLEAERPQERESG
jgi:hypothetical protein